MNSSTRQFLHKFPACEVVFRTKDPDARTTLLTVIYASLIPLIIVINSLLIFGIIKTKLSKFTPSQILFLTLFLSDFTFGIVQLPSLIYILWKPNNPTCFEIQLNAFSMTFPICMSGTILCIISIDRYISIVHHEYYIRIVTNKSLTITIAWATLTSVIWATLDALLRAKHDITKLAKLCIAMSAYTGTALTAAVILNAALLKSVKQKTKNSSIQQSFDSKLSKTIALIVGIMVACYTPLMIALNIAAYAFINSPDKIHIKNREIDLLFTVLPCQVNAILNSVIYLTRCGRMKRYYYRLFNSGTDKRHLKEAVGAVVNLALDSKEQQHIDFI